VQVDGPRLVAGVEEQLLTAGQARHAHPAQNAEIEPLWRIVKLPAAEVGLAALPGCVEDDGVDIDPAAVLGDKLDTNRSPVSFHAVAPALQKAHRHCLLTGVQRKVEVTVRPRLPTDQSVDTPSASNPNVAACPAQIRQYPKHLIEIHPLACSISPQRHLRLRTFEPARETRSRDNGVGEHETSPMAWLPLVQRLSEPGSQVSRERDLAVAAEAIMTRTAATAIAMSQRTQSMPGLPLPPRAV
jgi:hypothetical protein